DVYLTKYDGKGTYLWAKNLGSPGAQEGYGIALDEGGNIYIAGHFYDTMYFERGINPQYLVSERSGRPRMFVAKYDTDGNYIWARSGGPNLKTATGYTFAYGIAVDTKRNGVYVTGGFLGEASFV